MRAMKRPRPVSIIALTACAEMVGFCRLTGPGVIRGVKKKKEKKKWNKAELVLQISSSIVKGEVPLWQPAG